MRQVAPRRWWASFVLAFALLIASCAGAPTPTARPTVAPPTRLATIVPPTGTAVASATPTATPTRLPPSATPSATVEPTATIPPEARLSVECLPVADQPPAGAALAGVVVLHDRGADSYSLFNLSKRDALELDLPSEVWRNLLVSPDGQRLAARRTQFDGPRGEVGVKQIAYEVVVLSGDGTVVAAQPWRNYFSLGPAWLDADRLLVQLEPGRLIALNLLSGEELALPSAFPQQYDAESINWEGWGATMYDPTLTRVVYPRQVEPTDSTPSFAYTLWDVTNHEALASFFTTSYPIPRWSPDGSQFVVASNFLGNQTGFELYRMDREGQALTRLTNFSTYYGGLDEIGDMVWSPDGRYLAFWLGSFKPDGYSFTLAVVDLTTEHVTDYCVRGAVDAPGPWFGYDPSIMWAPNNQQLVVRSQPTGEAPQTTLIDLAGRYAVQISDHLEPAGWFAAVP